MFKSNRNGRFCRETTPPAEKERAVFDVFFALCLVFSVISLFPEVVAADDPLSQLSENHIPWHITADELSYIETESVYAARGNVVIEKGDKRISAEFVRFDQTSMDAIAEGHVVMAVGSDILTADALEINLATETGTIHNGSFFLEKDNFHITGSEIKKTGKNSYRAEKASVTTCDGDRPAWKITGRNLNVTIEGYGVAYHATFWVKSIPVMYTPFIAFPVKLQRQTGLLAPQIGVSSRKGFEYIQPFFWAINDNSDATFYEHYMALRGNKIGSEFRYVLSPLSKGTLMLDYLEDRKIDDGQGSNSSDWGYDDGTGASADVLRPNEDRYWFRMKQDQELPAGFFANVDLDVVSDQDYLREFKNGYTGYNEAKDYFNDAFGRDIDDYTDSVRLNRLNMNRRWSRYTFNTEFRWYDDVISRRQGGPDTSVQRLPSVRLDASKQPLLKSPLYFTFDNEYTYFYRKDVLTDDLVTRDHRIDIYPRMYLPLKLKYYATLEPSLGFRGTYWLVTDYDDPENGGDRDTSFYRGIADGRLDLSSEIYRIFKTDAESTDRVKHTFKPQMTYTYIPETDQEDYPNFDSIDRIPPENQLTYSLTNLFVYRTRQKPAAADELTPGDSDYRYQLFCRLYLSQQYDFNEASEEDPAKWKNGKTREPFSPIYAKLEITPKASYSILAETEWSIYEDDFISHNVAANLKDRRDDQIFIEHRYQKENDAVNRAGIESIYTRWLVKINRPLSAIGEYERDIQEENDLLFSIGALYTSQCWALELKYSDEDNEQKYAFMVSLFGLGELKSNL